MLCSSKVEQLKINQRVTGSNPVIALHLIRAFGKALGLGFESLS